MGRNPLAAARLNPDAGYCLRTLGVNEIDSALEVYLQSEDFLALGPEPRASRAMVEADMRLSRQNGGCFCGIYAAQGLMLGVVDYIQSGFDGQPGMAYIQLLMIALPYSNLGIGGRVVADIERQVRQMPQVKKIGASVQVNNPRAIRFWKRHGYAIIGGPEKRPDSTVVFHLLKSLRD